MQKYGLPGVIFFLILMLLFQLPSNGQNKKYFVITGRIVPEVETAESGTIDITKGSGVTKIDIPKNGRFRLELEYFNEYTLTFMLAGHFSKTIIVSTDIPQEVWKRDNDFPPFPMIVQLLREIEGIDKSFTLKPSGRVFYGTKTDNFESESIFNEIQISEQIETAITQSGQVKKEAQTISKQEALDLAAKQKNYDISINEADALFKRGEHLSALLKYQDAQKLFPEKAYANDRIAEIQNLIKALEITAKQKAELEQKYTNAIARANGFFDQKTYKEARPGYEEALQYKPGDVFASGRIQEINRLLALLEKQKQFDDLIAQADKSYQSKSFDQAISLYNQAKQLIPENEYPQNQINLINQGKQEVARLELLEKEFNQTIQNGDNLARQKDYIQAISMYRKALEMKPGDKLATDKIGESELAIVVIETDRKYQETIQQADKAFTSENYADARKTYTEALAIKPNEAHPTTRITKIDEILAEKARLQQIENEFLAMVGKGDVAFGQKEYDAAKTSYTSALGIKLNSAEVKEKIKNIESILQKIAEDKKKEEERLLALAAKEKAYSDAIALADKSFSSENYPDARKIYTEALTIKSDEVYPKERISKIDEIIAEKARLQQIENEFLALVGKGDVAFGQKEYEAAKTNYTSALGIKPNSAEVKDKIKNIDNILQKLVEDKKKEEERLLALAAKEKAYADAIALADKSFSSENYPDARKIYTEALAIKPNEAHPTTRITKIDEILAERARLQQIENDFLAMVGKGDVAFGQKEYEAAKTNYTSALGIKPNSAEVKEKIKNIDSILQKLADDKKKEEERLLALAAKEKAYSDAIALADKSFSAENYTDARKIYTEALAIKPNEAHPTTRITKIDEILAEKARLQQIENEFLAMVGKGDVAFGQKEYDAAKTNYTSALGIKPNSAEVKDKIKNIDSILQKLAEDKKKEEERLLALAAKEKAYADAIALADKSFSSENYPDARKIYTEALAIKPNEAHPTTRITKIDEILAEKARLQQIENEFLAMVGKGDVAFGQKEYEAAKTNYTSALGIKPNSAEVKDKIKNIDSILQKLADDKKKEEERLLALAAKEKAYADAIALADKSFTSENYPDARKIYTEALAIKPNEAHPTTRITKIDEIIAEKARLQQIENEFLAMVGKGDVAFGQKEYDAAKTNYTSALGIKPNSAEVKEKIKNIDSILQKLAEDKKKEEERLLALAAKEKAYSDAIALADKSFVSENYPDARKIYTEALTIKSDEVYPKERISKIDEIVAEKARLQQIENEFLALVGKGDVAFGQKEYDASKTSYTSALGIKPNSVEVKDKIKNIDSILQKLAEEKKKEEERLLALAAKEKAYTDAIALADKSFDRKDYVVSQSDYRKALTFKADETYPANRIKEIDEIIAKEQQASLLDENYKSIILRADKSFGSENYADARKIYTEALAIKPNEMYPTGQIGKIDEILAEKSKLQQLENEFLALVGKGDVAFGQKEYDAAKTNYTSALGIKPNSAEVKDKIKNIDSILQKLAEEKKKEEERLLALAAKEKAYADAIALADKSFDKKDYVVAQSDYRKALTFKADETYPANRIKEIDEIIAKEQQASLLDENYKSIILRADKSFGSEDYADARKIYTEALAIKPNDMYPTGQIGKIDEILAEKSKLQQLENEFLTLVGKGDVAFGQKEYDAAKASYTSALGIKPNSAEVKEKIKNIDSILQKLADDKKKEEERLLALAAKEKAYSDAIALADKSFDKKDYVVAQSDYRKALTFKADETYPANRIKEIDEIIAKEQQASLLDENYKSIILRADKSFGSENYTDARKIYTEALAIKPNDMYPTGQIGKIDEILAEKSKLQQTENEFLTLVGKGDVAFGQKEYEAAKTNYTSALGIKPNSAEVKEKIKNIDSILQKIADDKKKEEERLLALAAKEKAYADAIALADKSFDKKDYVVAQSDYRKALTFKADETYPANRIKEIDEIIAKEQQASLLDENYKSIILRADKSFGSEDYADARKIYTEALAIKPNDMYPTGQIGKIDEILAEKAKLQQTENEFLALVGKGDVAFGQKEYEAAKTSYTSALGIKPNSVEVKEKIKNIDNILQMIAGNERELAEARLKEGASQKAITEAQERSFNEAMIKADNAFTQNDFNTAKTGYETALTIKANDPNAKEKLGQTEAKLAQLAKLTQAYNTAINAANKFVSDKSYKEAKEKYQESLQYLPDSDYPKRQIEKLDELIAQADLERQKDELYASTVKEGETLFTNKEYSGARLSFVKATELKPAEQLPVNRIKEIDKILSDMALAEAKNETTESAYQQSIRLGDIAFKADQLDEAATQYEIALANKANDQYAKQQLVEITKRRAALAEQIRRMEIQDKQYQEVIAKADKAFNESDWQNAKAGYTEAMLVKPDEAYPKNRLLETDQKISDEKLASLGNDALIEQRNKELLAQTQREIDEKYRQSLSAADNAFKEKTYTIARLRYQEAQIIKPAESYPKSQIALIDKLMKEEKLVEAYVPQEPIAKETVEPVNTPVFNQVESAQATEARAQSFKPVADYSESIQKADNSFGVKDYTVARFFYYKASELKPDEEYPKNQIEQIRKLVDSELSALDRSGYENAITQADEAFSKESYTIAKFYYYKALEIKSWEKYPKDRIQEILALTHSLLSEKEEKEYRELIAKGDEAYIGKEISLARFYFNKASAIKTDENYPKLKLKDIQKLIDQDMQDQKNLEYNTLIELADQALQAENYSIARFNYNKALSRKPDEKYPKDQLKRIKETLDKQ